MIDQFVKTNSPVIKQKDKSQNEIYTVDDDQYPIRSKLAKGNFVKPLTGRSNKENSAVLKFWSGKGKFEIKDGFLTYIGKKVSLVITWF